MCSCTTTPAVPKPAHLGRYALNPELSFTWYDAAVLSQKIRQDSQQFDASRPLRPAANLRQRRFLKPWVVARAARRLRLAMPEIPL